MPITSTVHFKNQQRYQWSQQLLHLLMGKRKDFLHGSFELMRSISVQWSRLSSIIIMTGQRHMGFEGSAFLHNYLASSSHGLSHLTRCIFGLRTSFLAHSSIIKGVDSSKLMFSREISLKVLTKRTTEMLKKIMWKLEVTRSHHP